MAAPTPLPSLPDREGLPEDEREAQAAWQARYAGGVEEIVAHRLVPSPKVSVVVLAHHPDDSLIACLQHLRGQTARGEIPYEILLVDNGGAGPLRPRWAPLCDVELRLRPSTPGSQARNTAIAWARGEHIAIVDDDGLVAPTFIEVILRTFEDPAIVALRGRIIPREHPYYCTLAGHYDRGDALIDDALVTEGHMAIRRRVHLLAGGFPDQIWGHEGICLTFRIQSRFPGARIVYAPDLVMRHDYVDSVHKFVVKSRRYSDIERLVTEVQGGDAFRAFLADVLARRMPASPLPLDRKVARALLRAARTVIQRAPSWAVPSR